MLNVVTGVFIDSVMNNAKRESESRTMQHLQNLFSKMDVTENCEIEWEDFERQLGGREMQAFFKTIDVDVSHARGLFELLDMDDSGIVDVNEFMDGCLRIWHPARGLDLRMIARDINRIERLVEKQIMASRM